MSPAANSKEELRLAVSDLERAIARRRQLDIDIKAYAAKVQRLCERRGVPLPPALQRNPSGRAGGGLTVAIRNLFASAKEPLTAIDVHDSLVQSGAFDVAKYRNPLSVIHNTLRRMVHQGELDTVVVAHSKKTSYERAVAP